MGKSKHRRLGNSHKTQIFFTSYSLAISAKVKKMFQCFFKLPLGNLCLANNSFSQFDLQLTFRNIKRPREQNQFFLFFLRRLMNWPRRNLASVWQIEQKRNFHRLQNETVQMFSYFYSEPSRKVMASWCCKVKNEKIYKCRLAEHL